MSESSSLAGKFLLAMPGMGDPRFDHAVIAMMIHDGEGALGIALGQVREDLGLHDLLEDLEIDPGAAADLPVLDGGPVDQQRGFVLHSTDWHAPGTVVADGLCAMSASLEVLRAIAAGKGPRHYLVALGYAGWGAGQLDEEMRRHGWGAVDGREAILWDVPAEDRWRASWQSAGIDPALLSSQTGRA
ncbi:MAG: YqgE/AlgH family protein [Sphingomonadaceae bacterium]|nr:YqgE/AlgH family protein [Sphingomonadaceae bacterium]